MKMRIFSNDDPGLKPFKGAISNYTRQAEALGMPYWVFFEGSKLIGIVFIGKEPMRLLAPPGTPFSIISVVEPEQSSGILREFAAEVLTISMKNTVEYGLTSFPAKYEALASQFKELGFKELAVTYRMTCQLDRPFEPSNFLRFERVQRDEMSRFLEQATEFMSGSPDVVLTLMLRNLMDVPEDFLNLWYNLERLYFVYKDGQIVGILDLNLKEGTISNIGIAPQHRGKGYGRQAMLFGLKMLKEGGRERASLRVHVDNKPAIHLYETLGFSVSDEYKHLIWRK